MREYELNLIPADIIGHEAARQRGKSWILPGIGLLVFLILINMTIKTVNNSISQDKAAITSTGEKVSKETRDIQQLGVKEKELTAIKGKIGYLTRKGPVMEIFSTIDSAINDNITLTHAEIRYNFPYLTTGDKGEVAGKGYFTSGAPVRDIRGQAVAENSVILRGAARSNPDLAAMLAQLSKSPLYAGVNLKYSKISDGEKGKPVAFEIEGRLK
jgi:hypothetical protein